MTEMFLHWGCFICTSQLTKSLNIRLEIPAEVIHEHLLLCAPPHYKNVSISIL